MMVELDDTLRDDLARLRAHAGPSEAAKQRMWAALDHQFGPGTDGGGNSEPGAGAQTGASQAVFAAKIVGATVALTGAGLAALRAGVLVVRALAPSEPVEVQHDAITLEAKPEDQLRDPAPMPSEPVPTTEPMLSTEAAIETKPAAAPRQPISRKPSDNSLAAELALLQVAHDATSPEAALSALDDHLQAFPEGQLADERELLRTEALCKLGRLDAARAAADALVRRHPAMGSRVHAVCPKLE